ncbi:MAG TPA: hypothetical protein IAB56_06490 [Candidatus Scybalousia intestinigallinarum]|nr:hypothetical protein [Candidatus Scybalousia intestinigallinarum]
MDKEKLLLIKEILIYADKKRIKLPADVVSKLLKESIDVLQALTNDESEHKPLYLDFVLSTRIKEESIKKQLLDEIMEMGKQIPSYNEDKVKQLNQYVTSIVKFNQLAPTKDQLFAYTRTMKNKNKNENQLMIDIINQLHGYECSNQEILSLLEPVCDPDRNESSNLLYVNSILSNGNIDVLLEEKKITHETLLKYLSWTIENEKIASLLDDKDFCSLTISTDEFDQILTQLQKSPFLNMETQLFLYENFQKLVLDKKLDISSFLEFTQELEEKRDLLPLRVFYALLSDDWRDFYDAVTISDVSPFMIEFSKKIASAIRKAPSKKQKELIDVLGESGLVQLLKEEKDLTNALDNQLIPLFESLAEQHDPDFSIQNTKNTFLIDILTWTYIAESMNSMDELISFFNHFLQLELFLAGDLYQSIISPNIKYIFYDDAQIYRLYPYLIGKLSNPVTKLEKKKLDTALSILNHTKYGGNDALDIYREIIDRIFETRFNWQRRNIVDVMGEDYPQKIDRDAYLSAIFYMSKMKERDKGEIPTEFFAPSYELYQKQINEVDSMLKSLEQPKTKKRTK